MSATENPNSGHRKRLKDRYAKGGLDGFHDYEVIEVLLTYSIPRRDVKPLAKELLRRFKSIKGVLEASPEELETVKGMGDNTSILLKLITGSAEMYLSERADVKKAIRSPKDVLDFLNAELANEEGEKFYAIYLNSKNEILSMEALHNGEVKEASISPRLVIEEAIRLNARSLIFVHNIPGKKPKLQNATRNLISELESAATSIDILVHDHLLIGEGSHISAREIGWLKAGSG